MRRLEPPDPMFPETELRLAVAALEAYGKRRGNRRAFRLPCRMLICSLCEDGDRALTRTEQQLLSQAVRFYIRRRPETKEWLDQFI